MLKNIKDIDKNVKGRRLQAGVIYGSNPNSATSWCDQPTGPTYYFIRYLELNVKYGFWGVANARKYLRNSSQMGYSNA